MAMLSRRARWWMVVGAAGLALAGIWLMLAGQPDDGALERVRQTGVLRVGLDASFPPFEELDSTGQVVGYDADLAAALAARLAARAEFVNVGFDGLYEALAANRVDVVISSLAYDARRTRDVAYSPAYFNAGQQLVMPAGHVTATANTLPLLELLSGKLVSVEWGSPGDMEARRLQHLTPGLRLLSFPGAGEALAALLAGEADAAISDGVAVHQFSRSHPGQLSTVRQLTDESYVTATRITARHLAQAINQALDELRQSGALEALETKWF
jgi:ABC-type amino acid transport substrate-binding protein